MITNNVNSIQNTLMDFSKTSEKIAENKFNEKQFTDMIIEQNQVEANKVAITTQNEMLGTVLDIKV